MRRALTNSAAFLACCGAMLALPAIAQAPMGVPGTPDPSRVTAGSYTLDSGHSQVIFTVNHLGFSEYSGQFVQPTGSLTLDPAHPAMDKVSVMFTIAKVMTTVPALDAHLQKPEFFDAANFPEARFVSTRVVISGTNATITGDLTIKGKTVPVVLAARFVGAGGNPMSKRTTIGFAATTTIKRSDFGVSYGVPMVSDAVKLTINAAFEAQ